MQSVEEACPGSTPTSVVPVPVIGKVCEWSCLHAVFPFFMHSFTCYIHGPNL